MTYTPNSDFSGKDLFRFNARDGKTSDQIYRGSESAWVYVYVGPMSVPSLPPVAEAGTDVEAKYQANLDGNRSFDPAGRTLTYSWSGSGVSFGTPDQATTTVDSASGTGSGTYSPTLTVMNTNEQSASDSVTYVRTPGHDNLTMILLALFWAFLGVRYLRKGAAKKR